MSEENRTGVLAPRRGELNRGWFEKYMTNDRPYLLAFANDGVIWGRLVNGALVLSHDIDARFPALTERALQQALIFGEQDEIRLFHNELGEWKALCVTDGKEIMKESQILWGDRSIGQPQKGFTRVQDTTKGIPDQLVPLEMNELSEAECIRLEVHHTVEYDLVDSKDPKCQGTGEARIAYSRLAGLAVGKRAEVVK
jgi:CRISPR-associated protein (TIGR03984 family)